MIYAMSHGVLDYQSHITTNPEVRFGKPCIAFCGRIAVSDILEKMSYGMTEGDILSEWDYLTPIQIRSCLAYASNGHLARA